MSTYAEIFEAVPLGSRKFFHRTFDGVKQGGKLDTVSQIYLISFIYENLIYKWGEVRLTLVACILVFPAQGGPDNTD
jgi:hypothetical protein